MVILVRRWKTSVAAAIIAIALLQNPRPAHAFDFEILYMLLGVVVYAFTNNTCEVPNGSAPSPADLEVDKQACDPYYYTNTDADGLRSETHAWNIAIPVALTDTLTAGLVVGAGLNNTTWKKVFDHDFDSEFFQLGVFAAWEPLRDTRLVGAVTYSNIDTDFTALFPGVPTSGSFGTDVWGFEARVERRMYFEYFWLQPMIGVHHFEAETEAFRDTGYNFLTPSIDISATQVKTGAEIGVPLLQDPECVAAGNTSCPAQLTLLGNAHVFYHTIDQDGVVFDAAAVELDHDYFGASIGGGFAYHANENLEVGAKASAFTGGDTDGFKAQVFVNVDLFGLLDKPRPEPLFSR